MKLDEGGQFTPPDNPGDKTFAVLTLPDADGSYWCRLEGQWLRVAPADGGALAVLQAIDQWSDRDA